MSRAHGFTLVEVLVALAVFAVVSVMSFGGLMLLMENRDQVRDHGERLAAIQTAVSILERDLQQAVARPVRDPLGDRRVALLSGDLAALEFTRAGRSNPLGVRRSELERVAWRIRDGSLERLAWLVLDQQPDPPRRDRTLLDDAEAIELDFMDDNGQWQSTWPPAGAAGDPTALPRAVRLSVELGDLGRITRVVSLVGAPAQQPAPGADPRAPQPGQGPPAGGQAAP